MLSAQPSAQRLEEPPTADHIDGVEVSVRPRRRVRSAADVLRLLIATALLGVGLVAATWGRRTVLGVEADIVAVYERLPHTLAEGLNGVAWIVAGALPILAVGTLLVTRRLRLAAALVLGALVGGLSMVVADSLLTDRSVLEAVESRLGRPVDLTARGFATSPLLASVVAMVVIASTWLSHPWRRALWTGVAVLTLLRFVSSGEPPLDVVIAFALGLAVGSLALVVFGRPSGDPGPNELVRLVGPPYDPVRIEQTGTTSPLCYLVALRDGTQLELRLRTSHDRSADLLDRLWRYVRLRSSESDAPFSTLPRRVEHEALALTMAATAGARVRGVKSIVASPAGNVGMLVDHAPGTSAAELPPERIDRRLLVEVWSQVAALHRQRIAHRSLGLGQVAVTDGGHVLLDGFDQARLAAADRDLALDTAQLLVDSALRTSPTLAVDAATATLGPETVARAVPFLQPLALPGSTRRSLRADKGAIDELRTTIRKATESELRPTARLDRIRPRTLVSIVALAMAFYVLLPQLARAEDTAQAAAGANWWWLPPMVLGSAATYVFAALAFVAAAPGPVRFWSALRLQVASSFVSLIAPANAGGMAAGVRFLQRTGFDPAAAAAAVGLNTVSAFAVHLSLMAAFIAWTGASGVGGFSLPEANTILVVVAVLVSVSGLVGLLPPVRRRIAGPLLEHARTAGSALASAVTDPLRVLTLLAGAIGVTMSYMLTLVAAVEAFGGGLSFPQIGAAYLVATALASTAPTPGGLGAVEAALVAGLSGYGMGDTAAISSVLTFRLITFWLRMIPGWFMFQSMQRRAEL